MQIVEISNKVNNPTKSWEEFKSINDKKLLELEKKGHYDPLYDNQLNKINNELDNQKSKLDNIELMLKRSELSEYSNDISLDTEYKNAFATYLKKGNENGLSDIEAKSLSSISDPEGGFLIRPKLASEIIKSIEEISPMRELASVETISTDSLDIIEDLATLTSGRASETSKRTDTETPTFNKKKLQVHEMYAQPKATQKLIDDSSIDIEKWLSEKLTYSFSSIENTSFISGNGDGKPRGILSYQNGKDSTSIEQVKCAALSADDLILFYFSLHEKYAARGTFLMNRYTLEQIRTLKNNDGQYIWSPGLAVGAPDTLLGAPVKTSIDMPAYLADSPIIAFADFKSAYKIVDRTGIRILRDPFTDKPFVKFYATKRVGGDVINTNAIKLLKLENKTSSK